MRLIKKFEGRFLVHTGVGRVVLSEAMYNKAKELHEASKQIPWDELVFYKGSLPQSIEDSLQPAVSEEEVVDAKAKAEAKKAEKTGNKDSSDAGDPAKSGEKKTGESEGTKPSDRKSVV